jgi:hypothetical protein
LITVFSYLQVIITPKEIWGNMLSEFESGKEYYEKNNSLMYIRADILVEIITEDGLRTRIYNDLYLRLPQLNEEEKKLYESIKPLSQEENTIITILKVLDGLYSLESVINSDNKKLIIELIDKVISFLKKKTEPNSD